MPLAFVIISISAALCLVLGCVFLLFGEPEPTSSSRVLPKEPDSLADYAEAKEILNQFVAAEGIDEKMRFVRHPETTRAKMRQYELSKQQVPKEILEFDRSIRKDSLSKINLLWFRVLTDDLVWRTVTFEDTSDGLKLDWEQFVLYQPMSWEDYLKFEPSAPLVFRVVVTRDDYFNFRYHDRESYVCYRLRDPMRRDGCWGYAERDSLVAAQIEQQLVKLLGKESHAKQEEIRVMLSLRFVEHTDGQSHSQAWIERVVSTSWFSPEQ